MTIDRQSERFRSGAEKYAAYLDTVEGKLRLDLAFANLQEFLPRRPESFRALDIGGGTGATAIRLARLGLHVTLLDSSRQMLDLAEHAADDAGVKQSITLKRGDVAELEQLLASDRFDLILCHNILEYVEDPNAVLLSAARLLRDPSSVISVLVRNQAGEVMKSAIKEGDLGAAEANMTTEWGNEALYGGKVRLFSAESLPCMLSAASLSVTAMRGVRVISDYLPQRISRGNEYQRIFELERKLGSRPEFAAIARYMQCLAHRASPATQDGDHS